MILCSYTPLHVGTVETGSVRDNTDNIYHHQRIYVIRAATAAEWEEWVISEGNITPAEIARVRQEMDYFYEVSID